MAYIGGYLDGEGCFRVSKTPIISVANTYPYTVMALQRLFGGTIRCRERASELHRTLYEWTVCGSDARNCINIVRPYLWEKRTQADMLLEIFEYPPRSRRRTKLETELKNRKRIDYSRLRMTMEAR